MYMNWQRIPDCWSSIKDTELLNINQSTKMRFILRGKSTFIMVKLVTT